MVVLSHPTSPRLAASMSLACYWAAGLDLAPLTNIFSFKLCSGAGEMQHFLRLISKDLFI